MTKSTIYLFIFIGGFIGSYIPVLFGADGLGWNIIGGTLGSFAGIWAAVKLNNSF